MTYTFVEEYERVQQEYETKAARGIPMSVRERYERRLSELRRKIQALAEVDAEAKEKLIQMGTRQKQGV